MVTHQPSRTTTLRAAGLSVSRPCAPTARKLRQPAAVTRRDAGALLTTVQGAL